MEQKQHLPRPADENSSVGMRRGGSWKSLTDVYIRSVSGFAGQVSLQFKICDMFSKFVYVADRFGRIVCGWQLVDLGSRLWQLNHVHLCFRRGYGGFPQCKNDHSQYTRADKLGSKTCNHICGDIEVDISIGASERVDRMMNGPILHILTSFLFYCRLFCSRKAPFFLSFHHFTF